MVSLRAFSLLTAQFPPPTLFSMHLCLPLPKINIPPFGAACFLKQVLCFPWYETSCSHHQRSSKALNSYKHCPSTRLAGGDSPHGQQPLQDMREPHTNPSSKANSQNPLQPTELKSSSTKTRNEPHIKSGCFISQLLFYFLVYNEFCLSLIWDYLFQMVLHVWSNRTQWQCQCLFPKNLVSLDLLDIKMSPS